MVAFKWPPLFSIFHRWTNGSSRLVIPRPGPSLGVLPSVDPRCWSLCPEGTPGVCAPRGLLGLWLSPTTLMSVTLERRHDCICSLERSRAIFGGFAAPCGANLAGGTLLENPPSLPPLKVGRHFTLSYFYFAILLFSVRRYSYLVTASDR